MIPESVWKWRVPQGKNFQEEKKKGKVGAEDVVDMVVEGTNMNQEKKKNGVVAEDLVEMVNTDRKEEDMNKKSKGLGKGIGKGLIGVVAKPLSGLATFTAKVSEGAAGDMRQLTPSTRKKKQADNDVLQARQPRDVGRDLILLPYPQRSHATSAAAEAASPGAATRGEGDLKI